MICSHPIDSVISSNTLKIPPSDGGVFFFLFMIVGFVLVFRE